MLELRPNCEYCDKDLPPESTQARICSYECTFCRNCVDDKLLNVCPNCGGGFVPRPIRPETDRGENLADLYFENGRYEEAANYYRGCVRLGRSDLAPRLREVERLQRSR